MPTTRIYVIRHAHAHWSEDEGRSLSDAGRAAAQVLAERLESRPIVALYSSPSRRAVETVAPLANRLGLEPELIADLRERELPVVAAEMFDTLVRDAWRRPDEAPSGGESNVDAQARGIAVVRDLADRHSGEQIALATHGNLLALVLNGLDPSYGYEFWRRLSFPDVYGLTLDGRRLTGVERIWDSN